MLFWLFSLLFPKFSNTSVSAFQKTFMENPTFATRWNLDEIDANYYKWLENRSSVDSNWQFFFEGFHLAQNGSQAKASPVENKSTSNSEDQIQSKSTPAYMVQFMPTGTSVIHKVDLTPFAMILRKIQGFHSKGLVLCPRTFPKFILQEIIWEESACPLVRFSRG